MYKWTCCVFLIGVLFLSGCIGSSADEVNEIAAVVRGEEVFLHDLRVLYPDDAIPEMMDDVVKATLAAQEVERLEMDVSGEIDEVMESYGAYPQDADESHEAQSIRTFAHPQAEKLGMDPHAYYEQYVQLSAEMAAYTHAYVDLMLGGMADDEFGIEEYHHHANEVLDTLMELHIDQVDILLK